MREYEFYQVDVFTAEPFCGNPLVVYPDAGGLTAQEMQMIAREMGAPETTFMVPSEKEGASYRMRIFTPTVELPFTGHPAIGAHWVMAETGRVELSEPVTSILYEQGVGVLSADFHVKDGRVDHIVMSQCDPVFLAELSDIGNLARGLGVNPEWIKGTGLPVQVVSTGMPQMIVPMRSLSAVQQLDAADMDMTCLRKASDRVGTSFIMVFTTDTEDPEVDVHVRGFGHLVGIPEDPATGSANGALGAYLVRYGVVPLSDPTVKILSEQGSEIDRPSRLTIEVDHTDGVPKAVRVGGQVVQVARGTLRF